MNFNDGDNMFYNPEGNPLSHRILVCFLKLSPFLIFYLLFFCSKGSLTPSKLDRREENCKPIFEDASCDCEILEEWEEPASDMSSSASPYPSLEQDTDVERLMIHKSD